jgi:hypothetical protein
MSARVVGVTFHFVRTVKTSKLMYLARGSKELRVIQLWLRRAPFDITPCSPLEINRRFVGACRLLLLATFFHADFLFGSFFDPEDGS